MYIKFKITGIIICLFSLFTVQAQEISVYFLSMPNEMTLPLDVNRKKELLATYKEGNRAETKNLFNDTVVLRQMTDHYLSIQSGISQTEMALLSMANHSKIICVIHTVCAPVCDSRIRFYTTDWKLLNTADFFIPEQSAWFFKENPDETGEIIAQSILSDIALIQYRINPDDLSLIQTYNTPQYTGREQALLIKPYLKETPRIFYWVRNQYQ